jgi:hypothetical protein
MLRKSTENSVKSLMRRLTEARQVHDTHPVALQLRVIHHTLK